MELKLVSGFGTIRNVVPVVTKAANNEIVGDMHMHRRSGWRGGPSYQFHPNERGSSLGLKNAVGPSVRELLKQLGA